MENIKDLLECFDFSKDSSDEEIDDNAYRETKSNETFEERVLLLKEDLKFFKKNISSKDLEKEVGIVIEPKVDIKVTKVEETKVSDKFKVNGGLFNEDEEKPKNESVEECPFEEMSLEEVSSPKQNTSKIEQKTEVESVILPEKKPVSELIKEVSIHKIEKQEIKPKKVNQFKPLFDDESEDEQKEDVIEPVPDTSSDYKKDFSYLFAFKNYSFEWNFISRNQKFDSFYQQKVSLLNKILKGGEIDFNKHKKSLIEASVSMPSNTSDLTMLSSKMKDVQDHRDVIKHIQVEVNFQYFLWKRAMPLIQGVLARTYSERPAAKQDGITFEHLNDMEVYYGNLEATYHTAQMVTENLDKAFECLSRQVTIVFPQKQIEKYNQNNKNTKVSIEEDLI